MSVIRVHRHGSSGPFVAVLHGGPGAPGYMESLCQDLSTDFRVLEPLQRGSGTVPLTVAQHVADLWAVIRAETDNGPDAEGFPIVLVGSSWGAMLALATAAEHPVVGVVLLGCGTFDLDSRAEMKRRIEARATDAYRSVCERVASGETVDPCERVRTLWPIYTVDPLVDDLPPLEIDDRANRETWDDELRLQAEGCHPQDFAAITCPVLMLHGTDDPHPGTLIRDSLLPALPHLEYREWPRCGHYPWIEREHRADFLSQLRLWISAQSASPVL